MKQPVILQVLPRLHSGGVERGTLEIAQAIVNAGWTSIVASEGGAMVAALNDSGSTHITLPLASKNPLKIWRNIKVIQQLIRQYNIDIVHARSRAPAWSCYFACKRSKTRFITTFHGTYGIKPAIKKFYNAVMTKGDRVIAISHFIARHIAQNYPDVDNRKIRTIHRGADICVFSTENILPEQKEALKKQWQVPDNTPLLILPGRITRWKGQHILIDALSKLLHRHFYCVLVGDDSRHSSYREILQNLIKEKGLDQHIRFALNTPYIAEGYALADIVISPSTDPEAFGRVPVEAQAMGALVVATNHGGACETIIHEETGWLVEPNNSDALAKILDTILLLPKNEKERIKGNAMEHVRRHFTVQTMCQKTLEVYSELIDNK